MSIEEDVITRAIKGDGEAFAQLYEEYFGKIYRYVYLRLGNRDEAEDLTQQVFVKALEAIGRYKWRNLPFASWLFRIAHNQMIDYFRRENKIEKVEWNDNISRNDEPGPDSIVQHQFEAEELSENIKKLPPAQRDVISLRFGAGFSVAEAAKALRKNPGTVKALQYNAIVTLRKMMVGAE